MPTLHIEIDEKTLRKLIRGYLQEQSGNIEVKGTDIIIQVKSKQNYKSEWEEAAFRAVLNKTNF